MNTNNNLDLNTIKAITNLYAAALKDRLEDNNTNASHKLSNSIRDIVKYDGKYLTVSIQLEDYWKYVENGRRSGKFPPIDEIKKWISVKPVIPRGKSGKIPTENQLAFLIGRKISKKGTRPQPFVAPTTRDFGLVDKIVAALNKAFTEEINKDIEQLKDNQK